MFVVKEKESENRCSHVFQKGKKKQKKTNNLPIYPTFVATGLRFLSLCVLHDVPVHAHALWYKVMWI